MNCAMIIVFIVNLCQFIIGTCKSVKISVCVSMILNVRRNFAVALIVSKENSLEAGNTNINKTRPIGRLY